MTKNVPSQRSAALDYLRFFAVVYVFFNHYAATFNFVYHIVPANDKYLWFSKYGSVAVVILYMVSGYVVTLTSVNRGIKDFVISRIARLYPLFWISCIVAYIMPRLFYTNHSYLAEASLKTLVVNFTMIPYLLGSPMINPVFHTLMVEIVFYALIGVVIALKLWNRILTLLFFVILLCLYGVFQPGMQPYLVFLPLSAGMLFYMINANHPGKIKVYALLALNFFCAIMTSKAQTDDLNTIYKGASISAPYVYPLIITAVYAVFLLISTGLIHIAAKRFSLMLATLTYPLYLFHIYFMCFYWYFRNNIQPDVLLFGILMISLLSSWLINIVVEKPLSTLANQVLYTLSGLFKRNRANPAI
ncbi:MAG: acyltransferase [Pedobacter sp.]|uniref:acyltransferase family protein n=1 Tax=Pedobacter sp. TaxID=1411316 RepID=UPI00339250A9